MKHKPEQNHQHLLSSGFQPCWCVCSAVDVQDLVDMRKFISMQLRHVSDELSKHAQNVRMACVTENMQRTPGLLSM